MSTTPRRPETVGRRGRHAVRARRPAVAQPTPGGHGTGPRSLGDGDSDRRRSAAQAESQAADLRAGSTVTFGDVSFDLRRLRGSGYDVAWTEVRAADLVAGSVIVRLGSGGVAKGQPQLFCGPGTVPNFPLFWDLFEHAFRTSRPDVDRPDGSATR